MSITYSKRFFKAVEKDWVKEFNKYKKKLNKSQLKKLEKQIDKQVKQLNAMRELFVPMVKATRGVNMEMKPLKKTDAFIKYICTPYIKYTLLKIKKQKYPTYSGPMGDPYTCGPEYFRPQCYNHGYHYDWSNDRR